MERTLNTLKPSKNIPKTSLKVVHELLPIMLEMPLKLPDLS